MKTLGTCLPTNESMRLGDAHSARIDAQRNKVGAVSLRDCIARNVGGEVRYYKGATRYAVVSRSMAVRWFEVRADGDYPVAQ